MVSSIFTRAAAALGAGLLLCVAAAGANAAYPDGTVYIVVGSSAGGSTDAVARLLAKALSKKWGQAVVVQNKPGAMNTIATEYVAKSKPDGKTLLMASTQHTQAPSQMKLSYDAAKDFAPITMTTTYPTYLVSNTDKVQAKSLAELIAFARANPGKLDYGTAGLGSGQFRNFAILLKRTGVKMQEIPFSGGGPSMLALMAGQIDLTFAPYAEIKAVVDPAKIRMLAVSTGKRTAAAPDVPSVAEAANLPGFDEFDWHGLLAPAGTPPAVIHKIRDDVAEALKDPKNKAALDLLGVDVRADTPEVFSAFITADLAKWNTFFKNLNPN